MEGHFVSQQNLARTITNFLSIKDENSLDPLYLWNIVLIGHLIKQDLKVLPRLGVDFYKIAPTLAILDTHGMCQELLGPESRSVKGAAPITAFTLWNILEAFKCPFKPNKPNKLHNAGNGATYTLYAILMLALRNSEGRELTVFEERI